MKDLFGQEEVSRDTNYDHEPGKRYCAMLGLKWDEPFAKRADQIAYDEFGLSQLGFDRIVQEYAWRMAVLWCPRSYPWYARLLIAFHFLNPFAKDIRKVAAEKFNQQKEN